MNTDVLIELGVWTMFLYIFPVIVNASLVTAVTNSDRARKIFENIIQLVNVKIHEWMSFLETYNVLYKEK